MPRASTWCQVASGRSGERSEHPVPNDAGAIRSRQIQRTTCKASSRTASSCSFSSKITSTRGYGPAVWSEDFMLKFCPWQALFHEAYVAHRLAGALAADIGELDCSACRT